MNPQTIRQSFCLVALRVNPRNYSKTLRIWASRRSEFTGRCANATCSCWSAYFSSQSWLPVEFFSPQITNEVEHPLDCPPGSIDHFCDLFIGVTVNL
jgi:hypothetical protein